MSRDIFLNTASLVHHNHSVNIAKTKIENVMSKRKSKNDLTSYKLVVKKGHRMIILEAARVIEMCMKKGFIGCTFRGLPLYNSEGHSAMVALDSLYNKDGSKSVYKNTLTETVSFFVLYLQHFFFLYHQQKNFCLVSSVIFF